jgi:hypothetical protein
MLHHLLELLFCLHGTKIERLHHWPSRSKLWCVIGRRRKLLDHLAANPSGRLFPPNYRAVSKVAFHEEDHFFVSYKDVIAADNV